MNPPPCHSCPRRTPPQLRVLNLAYNSLKELEPSIGFLPRLELLYAANNLLTDLPATFGAPFSRALNPNPAPIRTRIRYSIHNIQDSRFES